MDFGEIQFIDFSFFEKVEGSGKGSEKERKTLIGETHPLVAPMGWNLQPRKVHLTGN